MGRTPCCDKVGLKKGPWTPEEDQKLLAYVEQHGHGSWRSLPGKAGLQRCGKSCRLRWTNYLRPDIKRGKFSLQEEQTIIQLHALLGNRWSAIATHLPKRTDNEIKNYWNTHLRKRLVKMGIDPVTHKPKNESFLSINGPSKTTANLSHMAQWESARLEAEARLTRQSKLHTKPPMPPCVNILKAWNDTGRKTPESGSGGDNLESPTSTLTFPDTITKNGDSIRNLGLLLKEDAEEWKDTDMPLFTNSSCFMENEWVPESVSEMENENASNENYTMGFTELLLNNSNEDGCGSEKGEGNDIYAENKDYWDNILDLVNSSPSDSSVF